MGKRDSERQRRDQALSARGGEIIDSAREVPGRDIKQMVSVRLDIELITELRKIATERGVSVSDLLREAATEMVGNYLAPTIAVNFVQSTNKAQLVPSISTTWGIGNFTRPNVSGSIGYKSA